LDIDGHLDREALFICRAIKRLTQARYIKLPNGRPFISPQDYEIGMFLLIQYVQQIAEVMEIKVKNLDELSKMFAEFIYDKKTNENTTRPDKAKMQRALKKLKALKIIDYKAIRWPKSSDKSVRQVIVTVKPELCDSQTVDLIRDDGS